MILMYFLYFFYTLLLLFHDKPEVLGANKELKKYLFSINRFQVFRHSYLLCNKKSAVLFLVQYFFVSSVFCLVLSPD